MTGGIIGHVVGASDEAPVTDASIVIVQGAGPAPDIAPLTDESGNFFLDGLPEGQWRLRAFGPGGEEGEESTQVFDDSITSITIRVK